MAKVALSELARLVYEILEQLPKDKVSAAIIALTGELGAGKTTFVQALAKALGVQDTAQSPTYVLMKSYPISYKQFTKLIHIDAYRLEKAEEFETLKPESFLSDPHNLVCVEWPERIEGKLPTPDAVVKLSAEGAGEAERYIQIEK